ncbi:MAG: aminoacyl-tRNA deacylase [Propionibacteriaceae bacterium]|nr:aminoacyl-tRNA deacylase [Propionibacteriaceae bacterium]
MTGSTPAITALRRAGVEFSEHRYRYVPHGGSAEAARQLGVDEHLVIKTLVLVDDAGHGHLVLMHGDRRVSLKRLARQLGVRSVAPAPPEEAPRWSGYQIGGTSPFGTRKTMPVWVEATILSLGQIYLNAGQRGRLVRIAPGELVRVLGARPVSVATQ